VRSLLDVLSRLLPAVAVVAVGLLPSLQVTVLAGMVLPASTAVVLGGVLVGEHRLGWVAVVLTAVAGALLGDAAAFFAGRRHGGRLFRRLPVRARTRDDVGRAEDLVRRRGGGAALWVRLRPVVGGLVPVVAGIGPVRYRELVGWDVLGATVWASTLTAAGALAGSPRGPAGHHPGPVAAAVVLVGAGLGLGRHCRGRHCRGRRPARPRQPPVHARQPPVRPRQPPVHARQPLRTTAGPPDRWARPISSGTAQELAAALGRWWSTLVRAGTRHPVDAADRRAGGCEQGGR